MIFKAGDVVKVYSLQSFKHGGFLNGTEGVVTQDQTGESVIVAVNRKIKGQEKIDPSYEVYAKQLEMVSRHPNDNDIITRFKAFVGELKGHSYS